MISCRTSWSAAAALLTAMLAGCAHRPATTTGPAAAPIANPETGEPAPIAVSAHPLPTRDVYVLLLILDGARADTVYTPEMRECSTVSSNFGSGRSRRFPTRGMATFAGA